MGCNDEITELERRGFEVKITRHSGANRVPRYYCRIRDQLTDRTFFGDTLDLAVSKALEEVSNKGSEID
jgi:hypothetical protein